MATVEISIHGKAYQIVCDQGQEAHLRELASHVNSRVAELGTTVGQTGETTMLVLTLLSMADELRQKRTGDGRIAHDGGGNKSQAELMETLTAGKLEDFANRIEQVAARLDHN